MSKQEKRSKYKYNLISVLSVLSFIFIWWFFTDGAKIVSPLILPSPGKVVKTFMYKLMGGVNPDGSSLIQHIVASLKIALGGYLIGIFVGVPLGIAMAWNRKFERFSKPIFDIIRPIPALAWIPLMILWLGIGYWSKVGIIFFAAFISATINSYAGIKQTRTVHLWVARTFGATDRQMLFKVAIPTALPMIFTGLRLALGSSWVALVAAELLAATQGVGYMIQVGRMLGRPDIIIVGMITIGVVGYLLSFTLEVIQRKVIPNSGGR